MKYTLEIVINISNAQLIELFQNTDPMSAYQPFTLGMRYKRM